MKRKQVRLTHRVGIPIVFSLVLLSALIISTLAQAAPLTNPFNQGDKSYNYFLKVEEENAKVCVGHTIDFIVTVTLEATWFDSAGVGRNGPIYYTGERVVPAIIGPQIGAISPSALSTSDRLGGDPLARIQIPRGVGRILRSRQRLFSLPLVFTFSADEKGTTTIEFTHTERARRGVPVASKTVVAKVEVTECWEAYATGLWTGNTGNNWTMKDICSLERPFVLEGNGAGEGGGATSVLNSKAYFFWPMGAPFGVAGLSGLQNGRYIYVGERTDTFGSLISNCSLVGGGSYQQIIYENRTPKEGNLVLNGSADLYCTGYTTHIDREAIQVAFRALGAGHVCQESLPGLNP